LNYNKPFYENKEELELNGVTYISGVMDEETRPIILSALNDLNPGEGMLVIFRLPKNGSSDQLLEFSIADFSPTGQWDAVSDKEDGGPLHDTVVRLANEVNQKRLPNILFSQGDEKVKATDDHQVCFGVMGGEKSGRITQIKTIVHQQLNMGLNGDLLLHESNLIMKALYNTGALSKDTPISMKSYGAGGSASRKVHPGDILTSDAVIDIRTHVHPLFIISYLKEFLSQQHNSSQKNPQLKHEIEEAFDDIANRFEYDDTYASISIVSDIEKLISRIARFTDTTAQKILENMKPEQKEYYGEICISSSSQGTRVIKRIEAPQSSEGKKFLGDAGQKKVKHEIVDFINKMGAHEKNKSDLALLHEKLKIVSTNLYRLYWKKILQYIESGHYKFTTNPSILDVANVAAEAHLDKLKKRKDAYDKSIKEISSKQKRLLNQNKGLEHTCERLHQEIVFLKDTEKKINPRHPFRITASGNIFFNHAEKESVHQFGAELVEMENQLFKQTIHKAISEGCYIESELVTKIAADPVCIPEQATHRLNEWAKLCSMSLNDYVEAYLWATSGTKQDMQNIPKSGLWQPANDLVNEKYPCGIIGIDVDPTEMPHKELKELLGNRPAYIIFRNRFFYADEALEIEELNSTTDTIIELIDKLTRELGLGYSSGKKNHFWHSEFKEMTEAKQHDIEKITKHRHRATYERLFYSLCSEHNNYLSELSDTDHEEPARKTPKILNPFWKEIGVDLVSEIENGKAFSGSIFKNPTEEEKAKQSQLKKKAAEIAHSPTCDRDAVHALFQEYLNYMMSKIPEDELAERGILPGNGQYPVYARHALYKTGYVSGEINDWDAAIYKANNSAVLVDVIDKFLNDEPVHSIAKDALIVYEKSPSQTKKHDIPRPSAKLVQKNNCGLANAVKEDPMVHATRAFQKALDALYMLQKNSQLEQHHHTILNHLLDTLLHKWNEVCQIPPGKHQHQALALFCQTSTEEIRKAAQEFEKENWIWQLIRPVLNLFIQAINAIKSCVFIMPKKVGLFETRPHVQEKALFKLAHQAIQQSWRADTQKEQDSNLTASAQTAKI
jgi:hypothetical protein